MDFWNWRELPWCTGLDFRKGKNVTYDRENYETLRISAAQMCSIASVQNSDIFCKSIESKLCANCPMSYVDEQALADWQLVLVFTKEWKFQVALLLRKILKKKPSILCRRMYWKACLVRSLEVWLLPRSARTLPNSLQIRLHRGLPV